jgi:hypothetical protein
MQHQAAIRDQLGRTPGTVTPSINPFMDSKNSAMGIRLAHDRLPSQHPECMNRST